MFAKTNKKIIGTMAALLLMLALLLILALCFGEVTFPLKSLLAIFGWGAAGYSVENLEVMSSIVLDIRLPRAISAILVGAMLACAGACMQTLFRNPLADPGLIGVSSGAGLAMALALVFLPAGLSVFADHLLFLLSAFAGGLLTSLLVYSLSRLFWSASMASVLLLGVAINAIAIALIGFIKIVADDGDLRSLVFWMLGSVSASSWQELQIVFPLFLLSLAGMFWQATKLNVLMLGEVEAVHLGLHVARLKLQIFLLVAVAVAISVASAGLIAFVALLVPHITRLFLSSDHRYLLPASATFGALLLLLSDTLARTLFLPQEIPLGVITALIGGPAFIILLFRTQHHFTT